MNCKKRYFFLLFFFSQFLYPQSYVENLDTIIHEKVDVLAASSNQIKKVTQVIADSTRNQLSLHDIKDFLDNENSFIFSFFDKIQIQLEGFSGDDFLKKEQALQDLKFAVGAKLFMHYFTCAQEKMIYLAAKNHETLSYWEHEKFEENLSFYQKNISRWVFQSSYQKKIIKNIEELSEISKETHQFLGLLLHNKNCLERAATQAEFYQQLVTSVQLQDQFFHVAQEDCGKFSIESMIKKSIHQVCDFSLYLSCLYASCQLPTHFQRHAQTYAMLVIALGASGFLYNNYKDIFVQRSQHFFDEHIKEPVQEIMDLAVGLGQIPNLDLEESQKIYKNLVLREKDETPPISQDTSGVVAAGQQIAKFTGFENYNPFNWTKTSEQNNFTETESFENLEARVSQEDLITLANPLNNLEKTPRAIKRFVLKEEINFKKQANIVIKKIYTIVSLGACIPAITVVAVAAGSYFASKKIYNSVAYQPIRKFIREIELLLNVSLYQPVDFEKEGCLYFFTEQLKLHVDVLTQSEQKMMQVDIASLQSPHLDYQQKFNVVQRMYRTYPCLIPGTV